MDLLTLGTLPHWELGVCFASVGDGC
jgi:hypothetical protein